MSAKVEFKEVQGGFMDAVVLPRLKAFLKGISHGA